MKDSRRRTEARKRAEGYAPRPLTSVFMYGVVGVCLVGLAWASVAGFYDVDPFAYPLWLAAALLTAFGGSIVLRGVRGRRHLSAHRREYDKTDPGVMRKRKGGRGREKRK